MLDPKITEAFRIMWGNFPEPVMLVRKDRTVLATNKYAQRIGIAAGIKCHSLNPETGTADHCQRCQANAALRTGEAVCTQEQMGETPVRGYWVPVTDSPDIFVHFGIGTADAMTAAQAGSGACGEA